MRPTPPFLIVTPSRILAGIFVAGFALSASAQVSYTGSYSQNFDGLASTPNGGSVALAGGVLPLAGWYYDSAVYNHYLIDDGSSNQTNLLSYGALSGSDRSLGVKHNSNADDIAFGLRLVNNTGGTITGLNISFTGEQWHMENHDPATDPLHFEYKVGAASLTETGYTNYVPLYFTAPQQGNGQLDGNLSINQVAKSDTLSSLSWADGQEMWIRWTLNTTGASPGMGIENLSITTVPEPSTLTLAAGASLIALLRRRRGVTAARSNITT